MIDFKDWTSSSTSDKMLTSSSGTQYLHPDYLQPLPTTLDAKKSPLALLAQTCSSIGKDSSSSSKSLIPSLEKKDGQKHDKDSVNSRPKSGSNSPSHKAQSPGADERSKSRSSTDRKRDDTPSPDRADNTSCSPRLGFRAPRDSSASNGHSDSKSPQSSFSHHGGRSDGDGAVTSSSSLHTSPLSSATHLSSKSSSSGSHHQQHLLDINPDASNKSSLRTSPYPPGYKPDALTAGLGHPSLGGYPGMHLPLFGTPHLPMDPSHLGVVYPGLSAHSAMSKHSAALGHSPFMSYTRVKTATGASTLVPVCKDPYCSHCQVSMQSAQLHGSLPCPAGCTQCQDKSHFSSQPSLAAMHSAAAYSAALGGFSLLPTSLSSHNHSSSALASLYSHGMAAAGPASQPGLPFVCNWVNGSDYCGKRFPSSEELLHHLRSHTSTSADSALAAYAGLGLSAYHSHLAAAAAASAATPADSASVLRQSYSRSLSPSLLAASRFHPYKSSLSSLSAPPPTGLPVSLQPPQLPFSPYSLYGSRLGATVTP